MMFEAQFLLFLGVFFGIVGFVYWFTSNEDGGTMMLSAASLLGFLSGSYYMFWHRRMGKRVEGRDDALIADGAGAINSFPGAFNPKGPAPPWSRNCVTKRALVSENPNKPMTRDLVFPSKSHPPLVLPDGRNLRTDSPNAARPLQSASRRRTPRQHRHPRPSLEGERP